MAKLYQKLPGSSHTFQLCYLRPPITLFERLIAQRKGDDDRVFDGELDFRLLDLFEPRFVERFEEGPGERGTASAGEGMGEMEMEMEVGRRRMFGEGGLDEKEVEEEDWGWCRGLGLDEVEGYGKRIWEECVVPSWECKSIRMGEEEFRRMKGLEKWQWGVVFATWIKEYRETAELSIEMLLQALRLFQCRKFAEFLIETALPFVVGVLERDKNHDKKDRIEDEEFLSSELRDLICTGLVLGGFYEMNARRFKMMVDELKVKEIVPTGLHVELLLYASYAKALTTRRIR